MLSEGAGGPLSYFPTGISSQPGASSGLQLHSSRFRPLSTLFQLFLILIPPNRAARDISKRMHGGAQELGTDQEESENLPSNTSTQANQTASLLKATVGI